MQPILIVQDAISAWVYRREYSAWNLKVLMIGGAIGVGAAWFLATYLSDSHVRIMVGVIGVAFVLYTWLGRVPAEPKQPNAAAGVFWGAMTGITSTLAQAGAPPFQVFMLPQKLDKMTLVGTTLIFFAALNWMKLLAYSALGQFTMQTLLTSALLLPLAIATNFFGIWLVRRVPTETFYKIAYALMFLISLELIRSGVLGIVPGLTQSPSEDRPSPAAVIGRKTDRRPSAAAPACCSRPPDNLAFPAPKNARRRLQCCAFAPVRLSCPPSLPHWRRSPPSPPPRRISSPASRSTSWSARRPAAATTSTDASWRGTSAGTSRATPTSCRRTCRARAARGRRASSPRSRPRTAPSSPISCRAR